MTSDLEALQTVYSNAADGSREKLWTHSDWQPPFGVQRNSRVVEREFLRGVSDREWAMYVAGRIEAYEQASSVIDILQSQSEDDESE